VLSRRTFVAALAATATAGFAACANNSTTQASDSPSAGSSSTGATETFPITIKHALGETVIDKKPERIATLGWANHEVPLALGVVPVGMSKANWGDEDGDGLLPWVKEKLDALGGQAPVLFDDNDGVPFEAVSNTKPDVILASYSGITEEDYKTLSDIAPVVAYPEAPWITTMDQMIELNSQAMGMSAQGKTLIEDLKKQVAAAMDQHAGLKGKKVLFSFLNADDLFCRAMHRPAQQTRYFSLAQASDYWLDSATGSLKTQATDFMPAQQIPLQGSHNVANALAAIALCEAIGIPRSELVKHIQTFKGLPHRVEKIGEKDGVVYIDDSKGTNVGATVAAITGLPEKIVLIAGGQGKGQDFALLAAVLRDKARAVFLIGVDAPKIAAELAAQRRCPPIL